MKHKVIVTECEVSVFFFNFLLIFFPVTKKKRSETQVIETKFVLSKSLTHLKNSLFHMYYVILWLPT